MSQPTINRSDLADALAAQFAHLTQRDAEAVVKCLLESMNEALAQGHRVEVRGFGAFTINTRKPRIGRNPRNGVSVSVPERRLPHFKPGKALRLAIDASKP